MVRARLRLRMKAARIPNRPAKFVTAKPKTVALEHLRLDLLNRFEGLQLDEDARKLCRWEKHFKEVLNHAAPPNTASSPLPTSAADTYPFDVDPATLEEVCTAIRQLRNNRVPEEGGIPPGVYKTCFDSLGQWLHQVITKVWLC